MVIAVIIWKDMETPSASLNRNEHVVSDWDRGTSDKYLRQQ
jgi:hypothetical protein